MNTNQGLFTIRIGIGLLFVLAGFGKITGIMGPGISGFAGMVFGSALLAWIIALGELLGGIAVLIGFLTRWASIGLAIIILGAIFLVHIPNFSANPVNVWIHLSLLLTLVGLALAGSGSHAVKAD